MPKTIVQLSDLHLMADPDAELHGVNPRRNFSLVLEQASAAAQQPDLVLLTGDLSHDESAAAYEWLSKSMNEWGIPTLWIPGNHDNVDLIERSMTGCVSASKDWDSGSWRVQLLSSQIPGEIPGALNQEQLNSLRHGLADAGKHVLVAVHHPMFALGSSWLDAYGLQNQEEFFAAVDGADNLRVVVCGHAHQEFQWERNGVFYLVAPATSMQFAPGQDEFELDSAMPGWRSLILHDDGTIDTCVHRLDDEE